MDGALLDWLLTIGLIAGLFVLDLAVSARRDGPLGFRAASGWSLFYVGVAVGFGTVLGALAGWEYGSTPPATSSLSHCAKRSSRVSVRRSHVEAVALRDALMQ